jgi:hypothetical protein
MTVRYSHPAPDFLLNVVEKLVPKPVEAATGEPTDTGLPRPKVVQVAHMQCLFRVICWKRK